MVGLKTLVEFALQRQSPRPQLRRVPARAPMVMAPHCVDLLFRHDGSSSSFYKSFSFCQSAARARSQPTRMRPKNIS